MATQGNSMKVNSSSDGSERSQPSHDTGMSIEKLDGNSNYSTWKFLVELYLIHDDLWEYTQTTPDKTDVVGCRKDQKARAKICLMVKPHCLIHVRNAKTAKEAWDALRSAFEDKGLNNRCRLLTKLVSLKLEQFTSVRSYVTEIMLVAQQLRDIGKEVDDEMLAALMLQGLTETFQPMRLAIENSGVELTTDYIKTKLLQMEDSYNTSSSSSNDIALRVDTHNKTRRFPYKKSQKIKCFICNGPHKARDCPENSKNKKASLALGLATSGKPDEWILDSGASSHMTNSKEYLMDVRMYDKKVEIGCANGSKVYGIGEGSVVCKENVAGVSEVMYVPHLATNLLSVSAIVKKNVVVVFSAKGYELLKADGCKVTGDVLYTGVEDNGVYKLKLCSQEKALASTVSTIDIELWHRRMGHLGVRNLKLLRDKLATGDEEYDDVLEQKISHLEQRIADCPFNYDDHIQLIQVLWELSELERWRSAYDRLQELSMLKPEHWLRRMETEVTLAHSEEARSRIAELFHQATLDCYSIPILSAWCSWSVSSTDTAVARSHIDEVLRRAGADPLSGKIFWDAKLEFEKAQLETMSEDNPDYKAQQERVLFCLEEAVSRPLLRSAEAWQPLEELAASLHDQKYIDKVKKQHEAALDYVQKITSFEDKLLTQENQEEKYKLYQEYIDTVKELSYDAKYAECDSDAILKVLYDRASTECNTCSGLHSLLQSFIHHVHRCSSRTTYCRVLDACTRRCPRRHTFWTMQMQQAERDKKTFDEVKAIFEKAISKNMLTYNDAENLWLTYLEYVRRQTNFESDEQVQKLRQTFRLAWDTLAEAWGEQANDCEIPIYWARLEYRRMNDPKQGKEIFEEIFKYGENKTMCKYWEIFIRMEFERSPPLPENKRRDLYRRALRFIVDYPPAVTRPWSDYERDYGSLETAKECYEACEIKLKEWKESYQAMKEKMFGKKQKGKQADKKGKFDKKKQKREEEPPKNKNKRKSGESVKATETKRKKDNEMEVEESEQKESEPDQSGSGVKRTHEGDDSGEVDSKRIKTDATSSERSLGTRDACTLFVSNLEFKIDEQKLRDILSKFGDIVSLRVKSGNKAFGGSICYCQYKTPVCVEEALKHDRTPLEGRPMFFSHYSAKKVKTGFKYSTETEKNKLFIKNLPYSHCTKESLAEIFDKYGKLKDVRVVTFKDGKPKGLAYVEYEDEASASQAIAGTNGMLLGDRHIEVAVSQPPPKAGSSGTVTLGQPKRDQGQGMRRTQLSSFIPSVLQKPVASTSTANGHSGDEKRPLSNTDFRNLLLKK